MLKQVVTVPTYFGDHPEKQDFDEPHVPVVVTEAEGVRIILGTDNPDDLGKSDVQIERRKNGWAIFINPQGDTSGVVYIHDDGRSFAVPEGPKWFPNNMKLVRKTPKSIDAEA